MAHDYVFFCFVLFGLVSGAVVVGCCFDPGDPDVVFHLHPFPYRVSGCV